MVRARPQSSSTRWWVRRTCASASVPAVGQEPRIDERVDQLARRLVGCGLRQRHRANRQRAFAGAVLVMSRNRKLAQQARQPRFCGVARRRQRPLAGLVDDALEAAEAVVNLQRQHSVAA